MGSEEKMNGITTDSMICRMDDPNVEKEIALMEEVQKKIMQVLREHNLSCGMARAILHSCETEIAIVQDDIIFS